MIRVERTPFLPYHQRETTRPSSPRLLPEVPADSDQTDQQPTSSGRASSNSATNRSSKREGLRPNPKRRNFFGFGKVSFAHGTGKVKTE
jgi:hypothetical protein